MKINKNRQEQDFNTEQKEQALIEGAYNLIARLWQNIDTYIINNYERQQGQTTGEKVSNLIKEMQLEAKDGKLIIPSYNGEEQAKGMKIIVNMFKDDKVKNDLINATQRKNTEDNVNNTIESLLGFLYEGFLPNAFNFLGKKGAKILDNTVKGLIDSLSFATTGDKTISQSTATKAGGKSISPDIATGLTNAEQADLTFNLNTKIIKKLMKVNSIQNDFDSALYDKINDGRENIFGFSLKRWDMSKASSTPYTHSSVLQKTINDLYKQSGRKSWNVQYAYATMQLEMAKNIIALMGPTNIGIFSGARFHWMDDIIHQKMLIMHVYSEKQRDGKYGPEAIKPYIESTNVYLLNRQKTGFKEQLKKLKMKQYKNKEGEIYFGISFG